MVLSKLDFQDGSLQAGFPGWFSLATANLSAVEHATYKLLKSLPLTKPQQGRPGREVPGGI